MAAPHNRRSRLARATLGVCLLLAGAAALAQAAGEVEFARGVGFAQTPGEVPRTLGKGLVLKEGDRLTTAEGASAIIKLLDGTRMTVRPNSEMVLQTYQFKENAADNSMLMQLVRGGFRAVTGLISKNSPNAARIQTSTATIGIRGTDFDVRVCSADCGAESSRIAANSRPNAVLASAKIVWARGTVDAVDGANERRRLVDGGAIYPGETVETGPGTQTVLAFRDESRITLGSMTRFRVDNFVYDEQNAKEGRFLVSVLKGSVRYLTGLVAKANNRNVGFSTATATIGIRGSSGDIVADDSGVKVYVISGIAQVTRTGGQPTGGPPPPVQNLNVGQGLHHSPQGSQALNSPPASDAPGTTVPSGTQEKLYGSNKDAKDTDAGVYVHVRKGDVDLTTNRGTLSLSKGETGLAGTSGATSRPAFTPKFITYDKVAMPNTKNALAVSVVTDSGMAKPDKTCK